MKKYILAVVMSVSLAGFAQQPKKQHHEKFRTEKIASNPEEHAKFRAKKLALALDLTEKQERKLEKLNKKHYKAMEDLRTTAMENKGSKPQGLDVRNKRLDAQLEYKRGMKKILTADQYNKWERMHQRRFAAAHQKSGKQMHRGIEIKAGNSLMHQRKIKTM